MTLEQIESRIQNAFTDAKVTVRDSTGGGDHIEVYLQTNQLVGLKRIEQQRKVMDLFQAELKSGEIHALQLQIQPLT